MSAAALAADVCSERGSTILETIFGMVLLFVVTLGVIQIALLLYARNVVHASAHEAARAAIERGVHAREAPVVAADAARAAIGGIARDVRVKFERRRLAQRDVVTVQIVAQVAPTGPVPLSVTMRGLATIATTAEPL